MISCVGVLPVKVFCCTLSECSVVLVYQKRSEIEEEGKKEFRAMNVFLLSK